MTNLMINAGAGTGKTFTVIEGTKRILGRKTKEVIGTKEQETIWKFMFQNFKVTRGMMVAFNKSIATELQQRCPREFEAKTLHSYGLEILKKRYGKLKVNANKTEAILLDFLGEEQIFRVMREYPGFVPCVKNTISRMKTELVDPGLHDDMLLDRIEKIITNTSGIDLPKEMPKHPWSSIFQCILDIYRSALGSDRQVIEKSKRQIIDFDDMVCLPVLRNLVDTELPLIIVDEAQDLNPAQRELTLRAAEQHVYVGDPNQSIYGFAGADCNSFENIHDALENHGEVITLPLSVTRRCPKAVVTAAKWYLPTGTIFEAYPENSEGFVNSITHGEFLERNDLVGNLVLCRTNAPLVSNCLKMLKRKIPANILGKKFGTGLKGIIKGIEKSCNNYQELDGEIRNWEQLKVAEIENSRYSSEAKIEEIQDKAICLRMFAENSESFQDLYETIEEMFSDIERPNQVLFSSIHRAKGLEADYVFLLKPEQCPNPKATAALTGHESSMSMDQAIQERNLRYVAITRAIRGFYSVITETDEPDNE